MRRSHRLSPLSKALRRAQFSKTAGHTATGAPAAVMSTSFLIRKDACRIALKSLLYSGKTISVRTSCTSLPFIWLSMRTLSSSVPGKEYCASCPLATHLIQLRSSRFIVYPRPRNARRDQPAFKVKSVLKGTEQEGGVSSPITSSHVPIDGFVPSLSPGACPILAPTARRTEARGCVAVWRSCHIRQ